MLRAGVSLDFETNPDLDVTLSTASLRRQFHLDITDVNEAPDLRLTDTLTGLSELASTAVDRLVARIVVTDDALGSETLGLTGSDAGMFRIVGNQLYLRAGVTLDFETNPRLDVRVTVNDPTIGTGIEDSALLTINLIDKPEPVDGDSGANTLRGGDTANILDGRGGNDALFGGAGNDTLIGGSGHDTLTGGSGADVFLFRSIAESGAGQSGYVSNGGLNPLSGSGLRDVITDFDVARDRIDLSEIDANSRVAGNQAFHLITGEGFGGAAGSLLVRRFDMAGTTNDRTIVYADVNGDRLADMQIELLGLHNLGAGHFLL